MNLSLLALLTHACLAISPPWTTSTATSRCLCPAPASSHLNSRVKCAMYCGVRGCEIFQYETGSCHVSLQTENDDRQHRAFAPSTSSGRAEVAQGKLVTASSSYSNMYPSLAVDGDETTKFHSTDRPKFDQPWLIVDLGGCGTVDLFRIMPMAQTHAYRFVNVSLALGDEMPVTEGNFSAYTVVGSFDKLPTKEHAWYDFEIDPPRCSRYAAVYKNVQMQYPYYLLEVNEIEVWVSH